MLFNLIQKHKDNRISNRGIRIPSNWYKWQDLVTAVFGKLEYELDRGCAVTIKRVLINGRIIINAVELEFVGTKKEEDEIRQYVYELIKTREEYERLRFA